MIEKKLIHAIKQAKMDLEDAGYTVVTAVAGYPWNLVGVNESMPTAPVLCVQVKRTRTEKGARILYARYKKPLLPSGFQAYQHQLKIWIDRKGWYKELTNPSKV